MLWIVALLTIAATALAFALGRRRALASVNDSVPALNSLPVHYASYAAIWAGMPAFALLIVWIVAAQPVAR